MFHKIAAGLTAACFLLFTESCVIHRTETREAEALAGKTSSPPILGVQTKSGEYIDFRSSPARLRGNEVVGTGVRSRTVEIDPADVQRTVKNEKGIVTSVTTKEGKTYAVAGVSEANGRYACKVSEAVPVSMPLSDIQLVHVRAVNVEATVLVNLGIAAVAAGVIAVAAFYHSWYHPSGSCPFVYSYNGEKYVLDAETYGTAVCPGLKRTEWTVLDNLKAVHGEYRLALADELEETDYTDEMKLVAVDHPRGVEVLPDEAGGLHTFARPLPPASARDGRGRDILPLVAADDKLLWSSSLGDFDPARPEDPRDELTFEFPKPDGASQAKLLVNAWTTAWGASMAEDFLALRGRTLPEWYADVNAHGPQYAEVMHWFQSDELYTLKVWVETPAGWQARALVVGGAPYAAKSRAAHLLDIRDVPGKTLRIKLRPPANFWLVNNLAVDYSADLPVLAAEIAATSAVDQGGRDVTARLAATDGDYLVASKRGDRTEVTFPAPAPKAGLDRTVLLKVSGYYDVRADASGEPRLEAFERLLHEPGAAARYALEKYFRMMAAPQPESRSR